MLDADRGLVVHRRFTRHGREGRTIDAQTVVEIVASLRDYGVPLFITGGWAVDAVLERTTRDHADLDLLVPEECSIRALACLSALDFAEVRDQEARRTVVARTGSEEVDLLFAEFAADTSVTWADPGGRMQAFPPDFFGTGVVAGQIVPCLSPRGSVAFIEAHVGPLGIRTRDMKTCRTLCRKFGLPLPKAFTRRARARVKIGRVRRKLRRARRTSDG